MTIITPFRRKKRIKVPRNKCKISANTPSSSGQTEDAASQPYSLRNGLENHQEDEVVPRSRKFQPFLHSETAGEKGERGEKFLRLTTQHTSSSPAAAPSFQSVSAREMVSASAEEATNGRALPHLYSQHTAAPSFSASAETNGRALSQGAQDCKKKKALQPSLVSHFEFKPKMAGNSNLKTDKYSTTIVSSLISKLESKPKIDKNSNLIFDRGRQSSHSCQSAHQGAHQGDIGRLVGGQRQNQRGRSGSGSSNATNIDNTDISRVDNSADLDGKFRIPKLPPQWVKVTSKPVQLSLILSVLA